MYIPAQLLTYASSLAIDLFRLTLWLALLSGILIPLERIFSLQRQTIFRRQFAVDLGYYFLNGIVPKLLLVFPAALLAWAIRHVMPAAVLSVAGHLPLWARLTAAMFVGEAGYYWGHRWTHEIPFLWRFHRVHHAAEEMDWLVNTHAHPLDIVFSRLCSFVPMFALGLAQPLAGRSLDVVPLLFLLIGTMWGFLVHANLRWRFGWLREILATPEFHHWHHTKDGHHNANYASMLPVMDRIFGSWYLPKEWPTSYGIGEPMNSTLLGQLASPFLPDVPQPVEAPAPVSAD
jgi:sterol desaturase/sphingolipid hydroxylase (fatty acid hydroxylase superfamily)